MSLMMPILHAGGFSWDEALVLVVAILAVPAISWFTGRMGKRSPSPPTSLRHRRSSKPRAPSDDSSSDSEQS